MALPKVVSGARVACYVNGRLYGVVQAFSWTSNTPRKKIHCIDVPYPLELATTTADVTCQMTILRTIGDGGAQGAGITTSFTNLSREKYFSILLLERYTNLPLFQADYCSVENESWNIINKAIMQGSLSISGIQWLTEAGT